MLKKTFAVIAVLFCMCSWHRASAQDYAFGIANSFKGVGVVFEHTRAEYCFNSFQLGMDMYGMPTGRSHYPGGRFSFSHNIIFDEFERNGVVCDFYWGAGFSAGYVHDFEKGMFAVSGGTVLRKNYGAMAALSGSCGARLIYRGAFCIDLRFMGEFGLHMRQDEIQGNLDLSCYINGLIRTIYPEIHINYMF